MAKPWKIFKSFTLSNTWLCSLMFQGLKRLLFPFTKADNLNPTTPAQNSQNNTNQQQSGQPLPPNYQLQPQTHPQSQLSEAALPSQLQYRHGTNFFYILKKIKCLPFAMLGPETILAQRTWDSTGAQEEGTSEVEASMMEWDIKLGKSRSRGYISTEDLDWELHTWAIRHPIEHAGYSTIFWAGQQREGKEEGSK